MKEISIGIIFSLMLFLNSCGYFFNTKKVEYRYGSNASNAKIGYFESLYFVADILPISFIFAGPMAGIAGMIIVAFNISVDSFGGYYFKYFDRDQYQTWYSQEQEKQK